MEILKPGINYRERIETRSVSPFLPEFKERFGGAARREMARLRWFILDEQVSREFILRLFLLFI
jgi:hypothetical protein